jgi:hypothetical protein
VHEHPVELITAGDEAGRLVELQRPEHVSVQASEQRGLVVAGRRDHEPEGARSLVHGRIEGVEELVVRLVVCTDELP